MTLRQLRAFSEAAGRARDRDKRDEAIIARAAAKPESDAFERVMKIFGG